MTDKLKNTRILVHTAIFPWNNYTDKEVIDMDWLSGNSGNQLFRWAMLNLFKKNSHKNFVTTWDFTHNLELQKLNYDYFILPMSNTLREGSENELKYLTDILNKTDAKVLVAGLGGMFSRDGFYKFSNEKFIKKFIETVMEKTNVIGLRDNYSYKYLTEYLGYPEEKFSIIGCPSVT
ncbi:polysaccharide pyruvyl transferase family protein [Lactococcus lactis]